MKPRTWVIISVIGAVVLAIVWLGGGSGSSSVSGKACGSALDDYHAALVDNLDSTSGFDESPYQDRITEKCDEGTFKELLTGPGYDYTRGAAAIAIADPSRVWDAFCTNSNAGSNC